MTDTTKSWADLGLGDMDISGVQAAGDFEDTVGEGVFNCITKGLKLDFNEKHGVAFALLQFEIATGDKTGETFEEMFWDLGNPEAFSRRMLKQRMLDLGMPSDFRGMPEPSAFEDIPVVVKRTKKGKHFNLTVTLYSDTDSSARESAPAASANPEPASQSASVMSSLFG